MAPEAVPVRKISRLLRYYGRLMRYAASSEAPLFHILWNNRIQFLDRTLLLLYYRLWGKRLVFTAHNVNAGERDGNDGAWNRFTLGMQYRLVDHVFVHTSMMKRQLQTDFKVPADKISVIPYGINDTVPDTRLTREEAREKFQIGQSEKVLLFFGNIAPYKGLEVLVEAMVDVEGAVPDSLLIIAGRPKGAESYWAAVRHRIDVLGLRRRVIERIQHVPDSDIETYFKAADVLILPYTHIFQSGVLFLSYNFGLPVIASDIASLKEDVIDGETGLVFKPGSATDLACAIERYFSSGLYRSLPERRQGIRTRAAERNSWNTVAQITKAVYASLLNPMTR
jgi:glycosyltransferase involved in cell wall biosynthesis